MKILWLAINPPDNPSTRYRITQLVPFLEDLGHHIDVRYLLNTYFFAQKSGSLWVKFFRFFWFSLQRLWHILSAWRYDVVIVLREVYPLGPSWMEPLLKWINPRLIFDFDDAIYLRFTRHDHFWNNLRDYQKTSKLIKLSQCTVAGSHHLADYASQFTSQVHLIPTVVDTNKYLPRKNRPSGPLVLGWMGTRNNLYHLDLIAPALQKIQQDHDVIIRVICDVPYQHPGLTIDNMAWRIDYLPLLQSVDIGLMPLVNDDYSQGKCAFKVIQYMACGIPPICSPVGENQVVVTDGINGYLADSNQEWIDKIEALLYDTLLRNRLGEQARKHIQTHYSCQISVEKWHSILLNLKGVHDGQKQD